MEERVKAFLRILYVLKIKIQMCMLERQRIVERCSDDGKGKDRV